MVDRLSTSLMFNLLGRHITDNQSTIFKLSKQINAQKKITNPYDEPVGLIKVIQTEGRILRNDQSIRDRGSAKTQLEAGEIALNGMNNIMNRIHEMAIRAGNDSTGAEEKVNIADELETLTSSLTQLVNTKSGNVYVFSGQQSDLQTIRLADGSPYSSAVYKHNQDNGKQRYVDDIKSSVDIKDALVSVASSATLESKIINPVAAHTGNLDFEINDGNGTTTSFTANITLGDTLTTMITKINAAFTAAGGLGSLAQETPEGYLNMDTSLITGNAKGEDARIQVKSSSDSNLANQLHIKKQVNKGKDMGIFQTLAQLDTALRADNGTGIRNLLDNLSFNSKQLNSALSEVGLLISQVDRFDSNAEDLDIKLRADLSAAQDIDFIKANLEMSNAQAALQTSITTSANFFSQTLSRFLG